MQIAFGRVRRKTSPAVRGTYSYPLSLEMSIYSKTHSYLNTLGVV